MVTKAQLYTALTIASVVGGIAACSAEDATVALTPNAARSAAKDGTAGGFQFASLASSAVCSVGGSATQPFVVPSGITQTIVASEPDYADVPDMNTLNESGQQAGRYLYQA